MTKKVGTKNTVKAHFWSDEEKAYLVQIHKGKSSKEIHKLMNEKFEYDFKLSQIVGAIKRYKLNTGYKNFYEGHKTWNKGKKGYMGPNKTSWKKGQVPHNYKPVGSERFTDGYVQIKTADPSTWELKQRMLYEQYHNCKLKKEDVILFADKNKLNFDKDNLIKVSRNQLKVINQFNLAQENRELTEVGINIANILIRTYELDRKRGKNEQTRSSSNSQ